MVDIARLGIEVDTTDLMRGAASLKRFEQQGARTEAAFKKMGKGASKGNSGLGSAAAAAKAAEKEMRRATAQTANLAAQFNDIGVMLAAGQSPLQLAVQQGTQINQVFAQMGGGRAALRGIASAAMSMINPMSLATLGIIAGGAALVQFGMSALGAAKDTEEFEDALKDLKGEAADARAEVRAFLTGLDVKTLPIIDQIAILNKQIGEARMALRAGAGAVEGQRGSAFRLSQLEQERDALQEIIDERENALQQLERMERVQAQANKAAQEYIQRKKEEAAEAQNAQGVLAALEREVALNQMILQFGEDSLAVTRLRAQQEREVFVEQTKSRNISEELKRELIAAYDAANSIAGVDMATAIGNAADEAARMRRNMQIQATGFDNDFMSVPGEGATAAVQEQRIQELRDQWRKIQQEQSRGARSSGGRSVDDDAREAQTIFESTRTEAEKYSMELARLNELKRKGKISDDTLRRATKKLAREFTLAGRAAEEMSETGMSGIDSLASAFGDFVANGFRDFKGFASSIIGTFKNMIAQMIAIAARNKILVSLGLGGAAGPASAATSVLGGGGGLLGGGGGLLGSLGEGSIFTGLSGGSGLLGGVGSTLSGVFSGGGLGSLFSIGGNAAAVGGGIAATIGAALPVIGLGLALFSLFKKKPIISSKDFQAIQVGLELTGKALFDTGKTGQKAARNLKSFAGGVDNFTAQTQAYFDLFFTESEKRERAEEGLAQAFANLSLEAPKTKAEFRELVESLDITTSKGRQAYTTLLEIAPTFAALTQEATDLNAALSSLTGRQGIFATLQDQVFVASQLSQGVTTADQEMRAKLDQVIETVRAGNIVISRNTKDTADILLRQELTPA